MRWTAISALAALAVAGVAQAQEGVTFDADLIAGWQPTTQSGLMDGYSATLTEILPPGETLADWTRMVTVASYDMRGEAVRLTAALIYAGMRSQYENRCARSYVTEPDPRPASGDTAIFFVAACDVAPDGPTAGSGDYTGVMLIDTEQAFHTVQISWRGELPDPSDPPITTEELADWRSFFDSVRIVTP